MVRKELQAPLISSLTSHPHSIPPALDFSHIKRLTVSRLPRPFHDPQAFAHTVLASWNAFYHLESFYPSLKTLLKSPSFYKNFPSSPDKAVPFTLSFHSVVPALSQYLLYYIIIDKSIFVTIFPGKLQVLQRQGWKLHFTHFFVPISDTYSINKTYWIPCSIPASGTGSLPHSPLSHQLDGSA